jgi:23S rRNA (cytidine1920-2'-O)/16S rRNA (cytidine1409-2'-O)-methyltransferase
VSPDKNKKIRLDQLLVDNALAVDIKTARAIILAGRVLIEETVADKPGTPVAPDACIRIKTSLPYVSRGGLKLAGALNYFKIDPGGWTCCDIGASTGGFTDCLLQQGAARVYAVDVAYGQIDWKLRSDPRVVVLERFNVRTISSKDVPEPIDLSVFDTSFISLTKVIAPVLPLFRGQIRILALVKPQFELPRQKISPGGLVEDETDRLEAVQKIIDFGAEHGLENRGHFASTIKGAKGNQEYLVYLRG